MFSFNDLPSSRTIFRLSSVLASFDVLRRALTSHYMIQLSKTASISDQNSDVPYQLFNEDRRMMKHLKYAEIDDIMYFDMIFNSLFTIHIFALLFSQIFMYQRKIEILTTSILVITNLRLNRNFVYNYQRFS